MSESNCRELYLNLIQHALVGTIYQDPPKYKVKIGNVAISNYVPKAREWGRDVPSLAHTMIGLRRMENIRRCIEQLLAEQVPGDLMEAGVWRGGATIFMRAILAAYEVTDRVVWVADSFEGLPAADVERYPVDGNLHVEEGQLAVSLDSVQENFARYGLLDEQVRFIKGWFADSLPKAPISRLALLRLDGDFYGSTWDILSNLYDKVVPGGFVLVDDYDMSTCRQAIDDYRSQFGIRAPLMEVDGNAVYWQRER